MSGESAPRDRRQEYKQLFAEMLNFFSERAVLGSGEIVYTPEVREGTLDIARKYELDADNIGQLSAVALEMAQATKLNCAVMTPEDFYGRAS